MRILNISTFRNSLSKHEIFTETIDKYKGPSKMKKRQELQRIVTRVPDIKQTILNVPNLKKLSVEFDFETGQHEATYVQEQDGKRITNKTTFADGIKIQDSIEVDIKRPSEYESQIIYLYTQEGHTQSQIAEKLDISQSTVSKVLTQAGYGRK